MGIEHESARLLNEILKEIKLLRLDLMTKPAPPPPTRPQDLFVAKKK